MQDQRHSRTTTGHLERSIDRYGWILATEDHAGQVPLHITAIQESRIPDGIHRIGDQFMLYNSSNNNPSATVDDALDRDRWFDLCLL